MVFCEGNGILIFRIKLNIKRHAIRIPNNNLAQNSSCIFSKNKSDWLENFFFL